jgi:AGCS family alanine or glycine:cation symporter
MTGLVVIITDSYLSDEKDGAALTAAAFATVLPWFPKILAVAVFFFAFSTMISWSYYGERCWTTLFGPGSSLIYKAMFVFCTFLGAIFKLGSVLGFSDLMVLGMALPNIFGLLLLSSKVRHHLDDYWGRYKSGAMKPLR